MIEHSKECQAAQEAWEAAWKAQEAWEAWKAREAWDTCPRCKELRG